MPIEVEGLREKVRALEAAGVAVEDLKTVMGGIAAKAAEEAARVAPQRSGALRRSIRGNKAKGKAQVIAGKARVRYAGPINYGWPKRNIRPAHFIAQTDKVMADVAPRMLQDGIETLLGKEGLL